MVEINDEELIVKDRVKFHHEDFKFEEYADEMKESVRLLPAKYEETHQNILFNTCPSYSGDWEVFFSKHRKGDFFKCRRYIETEFSEYLSGTTVLFEVGCGYGCTMIPLLTAFPNIQYIATDFSEKALDILRHLPAIDFSRAECLHLDIVHGALPISSPPPSCCLCIFALSAIHPKDHLASLRNIHFSLSPEGFLLFRDYGVLDLTMFRHCFRVSDNFFRRSDGTFSYYFDVDYVENLFTAAGFEKVELRYDCVLCQNRKSGKQMKRVFLHAVFRKCSH